MSNELKWVSVEKDGFPKKEGLYLCLTENKYYRLLSFAKKLKSVCKYDFAGCNHPNFYDYDSECGYYEFDGVSYWMPLPERPMDKEVER